MTTTCHDCPRQIGFPGSKRDAYARLFGWSVSGGKYRCAACSERIARAPAAAEAIETPRTARG